MTLNRAACRDRTRWITSAFKPTLAAILALGVLGACAAPPPAPEDKFYRLNATAAQAGEQVLDGVVEVDRFAAAGALANRPVLHSQPGANSVSEYHYHFWMEAPPILLQGALVSYLRAAGVASRIVTPEMRVRPEYTVVGRIMRLESVQDSTATGQVAFELALRREDDGKLLVLGEYTATVPAKAGGLEGEVGAIDAAVGEAFADFVADIRTQIGNSGGR